MKLHYDGSFEVSAPRDKVYAFLTDPRSVGSVFPGVESVDVVDQDNFSARANLGVGSLKGTVNLRLRFAEKRPPEHAKVVGRGTGVQSTMDFELSFDLDDLGNATRIRWNFDGNVGGLVGSLGGRILGSVAERIMNDVINNLKSKLEGIK
jgi:carbon monoxide dehydrogenase subunit G